jgi:uncharacterized protein
MEYEYNPAKDELNKANHGLSLSIAKDMVWDEALAWVDDRFEYDEVRMVALVPMGGYPALHCLCRSYRRKKARNQPS